MSVRILHDSEEHMSCLYCSTTGWAFGKIFNENEDPNEFLIWLENNCGIDPRRFTDKEFERKFYEWEWEIDEEFRNNFPNFWENYEKRQ